MTIDRHRDHVPVLAAISPTLVSTPGKISLPPVHARAIGLVERPRHAQHVYDATATG
jgi:hypothetical protein